MSGTDWLDELARRVLSRLSSVEQFRADPKTLSLALATRGVTAHDAGDVIWIAPSFAAGGTIGSRLQDRVQHLDIQQYGINERTVDDAAHAVVAHLKA